MISDIVRHPPSTWAVNFTSFAIFRSPRIQHVATSPVPRPTSSLQGITTDFLWLRWDFRHIHGFRHQIFQVIRVIDDSRITDHQSMINRSWDILGIVTSPTVRFPFESRFKGLTLSKPHRPRGKRCRAAQCPLWMGGGHWMVSSRSLVGQFDSEVGV
jgi:hypothetical protein